MNYKLIVANLDNEIDDYRIESVMSDNSLEILDIAIDEDAKRFTVNVAVNVNETIEDLTGEVETIRYDRSSRYEDDLHSFETAFFDYDLMIDALVTVETVISFLKDGTIAVEAQSIYSIEDFNYSVDVWGAEYDKDQFLEQSDVSDIILSNETIKDKIDKLINSAIFELVESE